MRRIVLALLAVAMPSASVAEVTDTRTCLTAREIDALIVTAMPDMLFASQMVCVRLLPASAFLRGDLTAIGRRVRAEAALDKATADAAVRKVVGGPIPTLFFATVQQLAGLIPFQRMSSRKDEEQCAALDILLAKLRTQSSREVAVPLREQSITATDEPESPGYRLCPMEKP